jgi:hypothetical protein
MDIGRGASAAEVDEKGIACLGGEGLHDQATQASISTTLVS